MDKNHTCKQLQIQGHYLDNEALAEIGPWMRWPYVLCASILVVGVVLASPWLIWTLAAIATATVFLPSHPFNYIYNHGVRHLTGTRPLPPSTAQGRFACGVGGRGWSEPASHSSSTRRQWATFCASGDGHTRCVHTRVHPLHDLQRALSEDATAAGIVPTRFNAAPK